PLVEPMAGVQVGATDAAADDLDADLALARYRFGPLGDRQLGVLADDGSYAADSLTDGLSGAADRAVSEQRLHARDDDRHQPDDALHEPGHRVRRGRSARTTRRAWPERLDVPGRRELARLGEDGAVRDRHATQCRCAERKLCERRAGAGAARHEEAVGVA